MVHFKLHFVKCIKCIKSVFRLFFAFRHPFFFFKRLSLFPYTASDPLSNILDYIWVGLFLRSLFFPLSHLYFYQNHAGLVIVTLQ